MLNITDDGLSWMYTQDEMITALKTLDFMRIYGEKIVQRIDTIYMRYNSKQADYLFALNSTRCTNIWKCS